VSQDVDVCLFRTSAAVKQKLLLKQSLAVDGAEDAAQGAEVDQVGSWLTWELEAVLVKQSYALLLRRAGCVG
jgi:hypothetical protein